jgi:alginate O-acetyltransferase complex protein AlgI
MLPDKYVTKLSFLNEYSISFGRVFEHINGKDKTLYFVIGAFIFILWFKNSSFFTRNFKPTKYYMLLFIVTSLYSILNIHKLSEFLYFNF